MQTTQKNISLKLKAGVCAFALVATLGASVTSVYAANDDKAATTTGQQVQKSTQDKTAEKRREIVSEAVTALNDTREALKALDDKDSKKALSILQETTGKLEIILARDPSLKLVPAAVNVSTYSVIATPDDVQKLRDQTKSLLDSGKIQEARHLMMGLASETDINTTNIPLATYPAAIKQAAKLIDEGKTDEAKNVLQAALNTTVMTQTIIPIPVVAAQALLTDAEKLAEKKQRSDEDNKHLSQLLDDAKTSIKFAEALGYGQKKDFEDFYAEIDKIRDKTSNSKFGTGFFEAIKGYMTSMTKNSQSQANN